MLYFAATEDSDTEEELQSLLSGLDSKDSLGDYYAKLTRFYKRRAPIKVGNSVWLQDNLTLRSNFSKDIDRILGATTENVDFSDFSTTNQINQWVNDKTAGLIPTIVDSFDPDTSIFIANALHFKDKWLYPFQEQHLNGDPLYIDFFLEDEENTPIPADFMLTKNEDIGFGTISQGEETLAQVIQIPYISGGFHMKIIFPENKTDQPLKYLEDSMTSEDNGNYQAILLNNLSTLTALLVMHFLVNLSFLINRSQHFRDESEEGVY